MARPSSEVPKGCAGCVLGAVLGLVLGSLLPVLIVKATTDIPEPTPAAGYGFNPPAQIVEPALFGGFFGLLSGAVGGIILGAWKATKSADERPSAEEGK